MRTVVTVLSLACAFAQTTNELRTRGLKALENGKFAEAEQVVRTLLKQTPGDPVALGMLAAALDSQEKFDEAERCYDEALQKAPRSIPLLNNLGNHYVSRNDQERARAAFDRVLAIDPSHQNANLQLARIAADRKQGAEALVRLERVKQTGPAIELLRAEALYSAGKRSQAIAVLAKLGESGDPRVQFSLGMTCARMELYDRAEAAFSAALVQQPDDFSVLYNLGRAAARGEHFDRAQGAFEVALRIRPDDVESLFELGRVYAAREDHDRAVYLLSKARRLAPKHDGILLALARATEDGGYYGDSALAYDEYLQLHPHDDGARRDRALMYGYTGTRLDEGMKELTWYVRKHPEDPVGFYKLAQLSALNDAGKALDLLSTALRLDPGFGPAHYARALLLHQLGRTAESLPDLQEAVRWNPKDFHALDQLGLVYLTLEEPAQAEKVLRRALDASPDEPKVLMHLGRVLMDLGREEEAQRCLEKFEKVRQENARPAHKNPGLIEFAGLPLPEQKQRLTEDLRRWIQTRPTDPELLLRLGSVLLGQGRVEEAIAAFRDLLAVNPDSRLSQEAGTALLRSAQYALARDFLRRAATDRPTARLDLAIALFFTDGPKAALQALDNAADQENTGDYLLLKARILDASGQSAEADRILQQGLRHSPNRPLVAQEAALLLIRHARQAEALSLLDQAIHSAPEEPNLLLTKAIVLALTGREPEAEKNLNAIESRWPEWERTYLVHGLLLESRARPAEARNKVRIALTLGSRDLAARCALARLSGSVNPDPKCDCVRGVRDLLFPVCQ